MSFTQNFQQSPAHTFAGKTNIFSKGIDHNQTYSFDSLPSSIFNTKSDRPLAKLHQKLNESLSLLNKCRQQSDKENLEINQLRQCLSKLNNTIHSYEQTMKDLRNNKNPETSNAAVKKILIEHNEILKEQLSILQNFPNATASSNSAAQLNRKISLLNKEIQEEKESATSEVVSSSKDEEKRIRAKNRLLKKEHDELEIFIKKEIEFEREEDAAKIKELSGAVSTLSSELKAAKQKLNQTKSSQFASEYTNIAQRIRTAKQKIVQLNDEIITIRTKNEKLHASIDIENENSQRIKKERQTLQKLVSSIKSST